MKYLNESGKQEYTIKEIKPYYKIIYTQIKPSGNEYKTSFSLYESYGKEILKKEFSDHMEFLSKCNLIDGYEINALYLYYQKKTNKRKDVNGNSYISYDCHYKELNKNILY